jgi:hypothetical protein
MLDQTHDLLSEEAKALTTPQFEEYMALAREVYGIVDMTFSGSDEGRVDRAIALQVNFMLGKGLEGDIFSSLSRGGRSFTFKDGLPEAHKTGMAIIRDVVGPGHGFDSLPSVRGHGNRKRDTGWNY